jgi:hypothetical protein
MWGLQAIEAHRVLRCRGFHIFYTADSQMAVGFFSLTPHLHENSWYLFLLEVEATQGPIAAGRTRSIYNSSGLIRNRIRVL